MIFNVNGGKSKDENLLPENIKTGVEIDGVVGTFTEGITGYGSVTCEVGKSVALPSNWKIAIIGTTDRTVAIAVKSIQKIYVGNTTSGSNFSSLDVYNFGSYSFTVVNINSGDSTAKATITTDNKFSISSSGYNFTYGTRSASAVYFY